MIRKKLLFTSLLSGIVLGMVSCLAEGENKSSYRSPAVISDNYIVGGTVMATSYGVLAAPSLQELNEGDCISALYTINYDKQPSDNYLTATDIQYQKVPRSTVVEKGGDMIDEYNDSIKNIQLNMSPYFDGVLFIQAVQRGVVNQQYKLALICNPDSIDEKGVNTVYLKSTKTSENTGENLVDVTLLEAFDLSPLISKYGRDTVIQEQGFRVLPLNLKYQIGETVDREPIYRQFENTAIEISVFK